MYLCLLLDTLHRITLCQCSSAAKGGSWQGVEAIGLLARMLYLQMVIIVDCNKTKLVHRVPTLEQKHTVRFPARMCASP